MTWAKVAGIVVPLVGTIIVAAVKLSSDAQALRADVDQIKVTVDEHTKILSERATLMPTLNEMHRTLDRLVVESGETSKLITTHEARSNTFWPAVEGRLKRIEDKIDKENRR